MFTQAHTPTHRGFDQALGFTQGSEDAYTHKNLYTSPSNNWTGYDWFRGEAHKDIVVTNATGLWELPLLRDDALAFINRHNASTPPWFAYFAFREVHGPLEVDARYANMFSNSMCCNGSHTCAAEKPGAYGVTAVLCGMITAMDEVVGDLLQALRDTNQIDDTVVIWMSDNGAPVSLPLPPHVPSSGTERSGYSMVRNYPLKGKKGDLWEGGVRVPAIVYSAAIAAGDAKGTKSDKLYHVSDWLPTIVGLAGGSTVRNRPLDGANIWESLVHREVPSPRKEVLINANSLRHGGGPPVKGDPAAQSQLQQGSALRIGDYKLVLPDAWPPQSATDRYLFNVASDKSELHNLYGNPAFAAQREALEKRLGQLASEAVIPMTWYSPFQGPSYYCANCSYGTPSGPLCAWQPWMEPSRA